MSKKAKVLETYPEFAEELDRWAKARGVAGDSYVVELSNALKDGEHLDFWAQRDPMEWLPRPRSMNAAKLSHWARIISTARNVLIFAPVALTWFAIGEATRAFDRYIDSGAESTANFLEFWQDGKGILDEKWRIGNVATLDFQIIVVLIIMSLIAGLLQTRALKVSNLDNTRFENERISLALRIGEILQPYHFVTDESLTRTMTILLKHLDRTAKNLDQVSVAMLKSSKALSPKIDKSTQEIGKSAIQVKKAVSEIKRNASAIEKTARKLKPLTQSEKKATKR